MEDVSLGKVSKKLWRFIYIKGVLEHLEEQSKKEVNVVDKKEENQMLEMVMREIVKDCRKTKGKNEYIRLYDGYLIQVGKYMWIKILMNQDIFVGVVLYDMYRVYRYIFDEHTERIIKTSHEREIVRGLN